MFALYVQFHGDFGPGGGFQAGVIFGAAFILYALIFGLDNALKVAPMNFVIFFIAAGLLLFAGVGVATLFLGGKFLDYGVLAIDPLERNDTPYCASLVIGSLIKFAVAPVEAVRGAPESGPRLEYWLTENTREGARRPPRA